MRGLLGLGMGAHVRSYTVLATRPARAAVAWRGNGSLLPHAPLGVLSPSRTLHWELVFHRCSYGVIWPRNVIGMTAPTMLYCRTLPRLFATPNCGSTLPELLAKQLTGVAMV